MRPFFHRRGIGNAFQTDARFRGVAAVAGYFVTHGFAELSLGISVGPVGDVVGRDLAVAALLGVLAALATVNVGLVLVLRLVAKQGPRKS